MGRLRRRNRAWLAALALLAACTCGDDRRGRDEAVAPPASTDEVHLPLPATLPGVWALEDSGAKVEVHRLRRPPAGGPACGHSPACLLLLPVVVLQLAFPEQFDLATITRDGTFEASVAFDTHGNFLWATRVEGGWTAEYGRLTLPRLGKSYLLEQRRFHAGPDGARADEVRSPVAPQAGVLAAYAQALAGASTDDAYALYTEAIGALRDEAAPLLDALAQPSQPDTLLARVITLACASPEAGASCQRLLAAAHARRELDSSVAALDTGQLRAEHEVPECPAERVAQFQREVGRYVFFDAWHVQQALVAVCRGMTFDEAAASVGAAVLPTPGPALVNALQRLPKPADAADAPLTRVLFQAVCQGPRWQDGARAIHAVVRGLPGRVREAPGEDGTCPSARLVVARQAAGLSSPAQPVARLLATASEERAVYLSLLDPREAVDRSVLLRAVRADLPAGGAALSSLASALELGVDLTLSAAELEAVTNAFTRVEACRAKKGCDYDVRLQAAALRVLAGHPPTEAARRLASAASKKPLEEQAVANLPLALGGDAAVVALVTRALAAVPEPERPRPTGWSSHTEVTSRAQLLAFALSLAPEP